MPRVTGPLFSFAASGTVAHLLTFRQTRHGAVVQRYSVPTGEPSDWQAGERDAMAGAAYAWQNLDAETRAIWAANSIPTTNSPWMDFFTESRRQRVDWGDPPLIPAQYLGLLPDE